jgi:hypothetical protein
MLWSLVQGEHFDDPFARRGRSLPNFFQASQRDGLGWIPVRAMESTFHSLWTDREVCGQLVWIEAGTFWRLPGGQATRIRSER